MKAKKRFLNMWFFMTLGIFGLEYFTSKNYDRAFTASYWIAITSGYVAWQYRNYNFVPRSDNDPSLSKRMYTKIVDIFIKDM